MAALGERLEGAVPGTPRGMRWPLHRMRARAQGDDVHRLDVEGDPRGGVQSDEYRRADPRDLVREGRVTMAGPGGAPQEALSTEERRERDRD